ncbi:MAG: hypothetical protein AAB631_01460 [Patescibacteria group bacterium]
MRYFIIGVITLIAFAVVAGFFVAGSPTKERMRKFDSQRLENLQSLQSSVIYYWQKHRALPASLDVLQNANLGQLFSRDPETNAEYEYAPGGGETFTLCATFAQSGNVSGIMSFPKPVPVGAGGDAGMWDWEHGVGRTCFTRTIDRNAYEPFPKN